MELRLNRSRIIKKRGPAFLHRLDQRMMPFVSANSIVFLQVSLAMLFVWFGLLKLIHPASAFGMIIGTTYWFPIPAPFLVPAFGVAKILWGVAVLFRGGLLLHLRLLCITLHMSATFTVLIMMPDLSYHNGNPLLLTNAGEYVIENVILITAALVILASITASEKKTAGKSLNGIRVNGHKNGSSHEIRSNGAQSNGHQAYTSNGPTRNEDVRVLDGGGLGRNKNSSLAGMLNPLSYIRRVVQS